MQSEDRSIRSEVAELVNWYFENNLDNNLQFDKQAQQNPRHSDEVWALLMAEAVIALNRGLDDQTGPTGRKAIRASNLRNTVTKLVGNDAVKTLQLLAIAQSHKKAGELKQLVIKFDDGGDEFFNSLDFTSQVTDFIKRELAVDTPEFNILSANVSPVFLG